MVTVEIGVQVAITDEAGMALAGLDRVQPELDAGEDAEKLATLARIIGASSRSFPSL